MFELLLVASGLAALAGGAAWYARRIAQGKPQMSLPFASSFKRDVGAFPSPSAPVKRDAGDVKPPEVGFDFSRFAPFPAVAPLAPPPPPLPRSSTRTKYDPLILQAANEVVFPPHILKAICKKESDFNPDAINPEAPFTLNGVRYDAGSSAGRRELAAWIKKGNDPATLGLNPSIGIAQVRVTTARDFFPGTKAHQLFDPLTCLRAAAAFLAWAFRQGVTIDTIDAYNVGVHGRLKLGASNLAYRDFVKQWAATYQGDF